MTSIKSLTLEVADTSSAAGFYASAFGLDGQLGLQASEAPTTGFRGFTVSLVVGQPGNVDSLIGAALADGATELKPLKRSFWGYGGVVRAPDGSIWKVATSKKKNSEPVTKRFDDIVLLLGVDDVSASKRFYLERGLTVKRGFGSKYVEFASPDGDAFKLALYGRRALAKDAGVPAEGSGSHRIVIVGDAGAFTDPDGFAWIEA